LALSLLLGTAAPLSAQEPAPLRLVAKGDTVLVYLPATPVNGFVLYRSLVGQAGASGRTQLTAAPVRRVREPAQAAGLLGTELAMAMRAVRAVDDGELLRRLNSDRFAADVLSWLSRPVALVLGRLYVDTAVTPGATYEYRAVLTGPDGGETDKAHSGRVRVADVPPATPSRLAAQPGDHQVRLSWSYPAYRADPLDLVVGFHIYRAEGQGPWRRLTVSPVLRDDSAPLQFTDAAAENGPSYRYQVTAVDIAGRESAPTPPVVIAAKDITPPATPTDLAARAGDGTVYLTWRLGAEGDLAGYHVERATTITEPGQRLNRTLIPAGQPVFLDTVPATRQYFYRVIAVDRAGNASNASNSFAVVPEDKTPPAPPTGVRITVAARRLSVRWNASATPGVRGYFVYRGEDSARIVRLMSGPIEATQFVDSGYGGKGLKAGGSYVVQVSAVDSSFNESAKVGATVSLVDDEAPSPPSGFDVLNISGRYAEIEWAPSGSLDVATYLLTRAVGDSAPVALARLPRDGSRWRDTTVIRGRRYIYRLVAADSAGNRSTARVDTLAFRDFTAPPSPRTAAARVTPGGVVVTWERVVAKELAGYVVYRSAIPTGVFQRVGNAAANVLTFTDPTGRAGLYYVVRAVDRSGNESRSSPPAGVNP
jgi:fibronectin type 3 domain-containing protein